MIPQFDPAVVAVLPPRLFADSSYYALMARYKRVVIDPEVRYDKRAKSVHRFTIAEARGPVALTVPVSRPAGAFEGGALSWNRVTVSAHGRWWETIPATLATNYGRSPFFEYYIDRLMGVLAEPQGESITELDDLADAIVRRILGLECEVLTRIPDNAEEIHDFRRMPITTTVQPYWQIHPTPGSLSILDLIFNTGPEAPLYLR